MDVLLAKDNISHGEAIFNPLNYNLFKSRLMYVDVILGFLDVLPCLRLVRFLM